MKRPTAQPLVRCCTNHDPFYPLNSRAYIHDRFTIIIGYVYRCLRIRSSTRKQATGQILHPEGIFHYNAIGDAQTIATLVSLDSIALILFFKLKGKKAE